MQDHEGSRPTDAMNATVNVKQITDPHVRWFMHRRFPHGTLVVDLPVQFQKGSNGPNPIDDLPRCFLRNGWKLVALGNVDRSAEGQIKLFRPLLSGLFHVGSMSPLSRNIILGVDAPSIVLVPWLLCNYCLIA